MLAMNTDWELPGIISLAGPQTPIGNAKFGGRLQGTSGTGFAKYRVYGMYALVLLLEGAGRYRDRRGMDRRLKAGDLIVVFPELPHQYGPEQGDTWDEIFIAFDGAAFEGWRAHGLDPALPVWSLEPLEEWTRRFSDLLQMPVASTCGACVAASAVHCLIADALAARSADTCDWLEAARHALGGGSVSQTIQDIATEFGMGYETFRKAFKSATGESPARYRRRQRLAQASMMLERADLSLEMIATALGFCDAFHLSKAFKLEYGISPAAHRARIHSAFEAADAGALPE
jgi:AraC-like DNA-binding protein